MQVDCPDCGASLSANPGAEVVCPACMTPFLVPSSARAVRAFDVQPAGEAVLHALSRHAIREAIYTGRFDASTKVRHDSGKWELIGGYPEFAAVFRLLGGDLAPMAGTRKLAGWGRGRRDESDTAGRPTAPRAAPRPTAPAPTTAAPTKAAPTTAAPTAAAPTRSPTVPGLRSPTLVPAPPKDGPPPALPAATAPVAAATAAAIADAEAEGQVLVPVTKFERERKPSRAPLVVGGLMVAAAVAVWALAG